MKHKKAILIAAGVLICLGAVPAAAAVIGASAAPSPVEIPSGSIVYAADGSEYSRLSMFSAEEYGGAVSYFAQENSGLSTWIRCLFGGSGSVSEKLAESILPGCSPSRKISAAKYLEQTYSPEELSAMLCSSVGFGNGIYGISSAASYYFGSSPSALDEQQLAALAEISRSEKYRSMSVQELSAEPRFSNVTFSADSGCSRLYGSDYITEMVRQLRAILTEQGRTPEEADRLIFCDGLEIRTPLDAASQAVLDQEIGGAEDPGAFQTAMQIMDYSGGVLASVGGIGTDNHVDRTQKAFSPGSSIKPLSVYAPAVEEGLIHYSSVLPDYPFLPEKEWPQNFDHIYDNKVTTARAIRRSKNTTPMFIADRLGEDTCFSFLLHGGFSHLDAEDDSLMSMSLGYMEGGVTVCEMSAAYAAFGNGGLYYPPTFIRSVELNGETLYQYSEEPVRMYTEDTAWIMNRLLESNTRMNEGLGTAAALGVTEVFGKTGTTDSSGVVDNNWFVGGTPEKVAAVWVGLDGREINSGMASTTRLWNLVMSQIECGTAEFTPSDGTVCLQFCTESGGLAGENCQYKENGWYIPDNIPEKCEMHQQ